MSVAHKQAAVVEPSAPEGIVFTVTYHGKRETGVRSISLRLEYGEMVLERYITAGEARSLSKALHDYADLAEGDKA